ncbi:nuclear protein [Agyrium rufum]|nr:nuclear protein [Agyrium rufum]
MARLRQTASEDGDENEQGSAHAALSHLARRNSHDHSPSPAVSFSSDKENRQQRPASSATSASKHATPSSVEPSSKRRRLGERTTTNEAMSQPSPTKRRERLLYDPAYYDPDQPMEERRAVRRDLRDLAKVFADSKNEYMAANSSGIIDTIEQANKLMDNVKQTSEATLDSRLLVSTADLSMRRSQQLKLGNNYQGIDVDEFVSKCVSYMRRKPISSQTQQPRQRRRRRRSASHVSADESSDEGDALNWAYLGSSLAFPSNIRPPVPGFLLGPLSVQKKARKQTQRRERLQKRDPRDAVRPEEIQTKDFEKRAESDLTELVRGIHVTLMQQQLESTARADQEVTDETTEEEALAIMDTHGVADDGGLQFFRVVCNPKSFGQTVENMFYISFLIKEGKAGIGRDSNGFPTLHLTGKDKGKTRDGDEPVRESAPKNQAIFHLDFPTWEGIVKAFDIKESVIKHRREETNAPALSATGWYG